MSDWYRAARQMSVGNWPGPYFEIRGAGFIPDSWRQPGPDQRRAAAKIAEGFCPMTGPGGDGCAPIPLDGNTCPICRVTWRLSPRGFTADWTSPHGRYHIACPAGEA